MRNPFGKFLTLALVAIALAANQARGAETLVGNQQEYGAAVESAEPGDTIILANGVWRDFEILFTGHGRAGEPITLTAETRGEVIISGRSNLRLAGEHLVVSGLVFRDGHTPTNTVIAFRRTRGDLARHSRVTETVIDHFNNPERFETDFWVMMYGRHNRFDHNHLEGKSNAGVTMAVRLDSEESRRNHHRIDHNYFGPRPVLGSNGGETLRIGTSAWSRMNSFTVVENNYFDRCNGEVEIISSKSGGNVFRGNVFHESQGTLTLRHGHGNTVENNVFLGNRVSHTGGIRVINRDQAVRNNYLQGLTGHRFGGALVVMNGVPNSPINRYDQVDGAIIENNSIIDSDHIELAAGSDEERSAPPINSVFRSNLVHNSDDRSIFSAYDDLSGIDFQANVIHESVAPEANPPEPGDEFVYSSIALRRSANGLLHPASEEFNGIGVPRDLAVLDREATGVSWYPKPGPEVRFGFGQTREIDPGLDSIFDAVAEARAGDTISLSPGEYLESKIVVVDRPLAILAPTGEATIEFERTALFEIVDGGGLRLDGLTLSGKSAPDVTGNSAIRTSRYSMVSPYVLELENVTVSDLNSNHSFNFFSPAKHTFASLIQIANSRFRNITGDVLALELETEDIGIYNAETVTIRDSTFENIEGALANVYRGGTDESTFGPHFELRASTLLSVGNGSRNATNASVRLHGAQHVEIIDNTLSGSKPIRITTIVGDPVNTLDRNRFENTPLPIVGDASETGP